MRQFTAINLMIKIIHFECDRRIKKSLKTFPNQLSVASSSVTWWICEIPPVHFGNRNFLSSNVGWRRYYQTLVPSPKNLEKSLSFFSLSKNPEYTLQEICCSHVTQMHSSEYVWLLSTTVGGTPSSSYRFPLQPSHENAVVPSPLLFHIIAELCTKNYGWAESSGLQLTWFFLVCHLTRGRF